MFLSLNPLHLMLSGLRLWIGLQSEKVSNAAYNANWIDASPRFRKSLLIMMIGGRKPLGLTCGKFSVISGGTFLGVNILYFP